MISGCLQGLQHRRASADDPGAEELREGIEHLERRIEELTGFRTGTEMYE